jgi:DNA-binding MarR family transcriptional regulator
MNDQRGRAAMRKTKAVQAPGEPANSIQLEGYVPYLLRATANKLSQSRSAEYKRLFGIGLNEWSCLALLAKEPEITAGRITEVSGFDKAVISRSLRALEDKGMVCSVSAPEHNRKRIISLTPEGRRVHDEIMKLALAKEQLLLTGLSESERKQLVTSLRRLHGNVSLMLDE